MERKTEERENGNKSTIKRQKGESMERKEE